MATKNYDIVIVGGGPAGLSAAIYTSRAKLSTVIIEKGRPGGQARTTESMENYPGLFKDMTGPQLMENFTEHARAFGAEIVTDSVVSAELTADRKILTTQKGDEYSAKAVIIATGAEPRMLGVPGERALRGKGVSYCATCDADFFEDLDVVVVGNGDAAIEEAMYLTKFVNSATIIVVHDEGILDATALIRDRAFANPKLKWVWNSVLDEVVGDGIVESVVVKNIKTNEKTQLDTNGVFIFVGTVPKTDFLKGVVDMDERGYIPTNDMLETSVEGVYCAGDARVKYIRQVVTAAGDGACAAIHAEKYIHEEEGFRETVLEPDIPVMVTFWSPTSQASLDIMPAVEKIAEENSARIKHVKIDIYKNQRVAKRYGIAAAPSFVFFSRGQVIDKIEGAAGEADLSGKVASVLARCQ